MFWTERDIPDQAGRVAVVTGANSGLGMATTSALARAGAHVVMAARSRSKVEAARDEILAFEPDASIEVAIVDLADQSSITSGAEEILSAHDTVDLLINNAGLMATPEQQTADGFEMQFGVNHLGHWTLTAGLMPGLLRARAARVVTVTSFARHTGSTIDAANPHLVGSYDPWGAYARSKLANFHFGLGLQRVFDDAGVGAASLIAHPGLSNTNLQTQTAEAGGVGASGPFWVEMAERIGMRAEEGARPQLRAATDPGAAGGELYGPRFGVTGPAVKLPVLRPGADDAIATLWEVSERETGVSIEVPPARDGDSEDSRAA